MGSHVFKMEVCEDMYSLFLTLSYHVTQMLFSNSSNARIFKITDTLSFVFYMILAVTQSTKLIAIATSKGNS